MDSPVNPSEHLVTFPTDIPHRHTPQTYFTDILLRSGILRSGILRSGILRVRHPSGQASFGSLSFKLSTTVGLVSCVWRGRAFGVCLPHFAVGHVPRSCFFKRTTARCCFSCQTNDTECACRQGSDRCDGPAPVEAQLQYPMQRCRHSRPLTCLRMRACMR